MNMSNTVALEAISSDQLTDVTGGISFGWVKPAAKFVGKRLLGPASAVYAGYQGGNAYFDARDHGQSVKSSLWAGVKKAVVG
jgi:hypothetical protein